jgi:hypothetical protein
VTPIAVRLLRKPLLDRPLSRYWWTACRMVALHHGPSISNYRTVLLEVSSEALVADGTPLRYKTACASPVSGADVGEHDEPFRNHSTDDDTVR